MAKKVSRSFIDASEVLFIGYSRRQASYCRTVLEAFERAGAKVYAVNPNGGSGTAKVYESLDSLPARPSLAYVLTGKATTAKLLDDLAAHGVKRALFNSSMSIDQAGLDRCEALGIEAAVGCPLMVLGKGFHRFHGFLAGVRA